MATRRERVVLELEDQFSRQTLQAAAAAKTLGKSLDDVDHSSAGANRGISDTGSSSQKTSREIDRLSGRLRLFRDVGVTLGPALLPISAVALPAITGLAAQFGAAAIAGGTALAAFQGVGDTLDAVNKAALEPTAENLEAARAALQALSPEAREFVQQIQDMRPAFTALRDAAAGGLFPGLSAALDEAAGSFDTIETILYRVGDAAGDLAEDFAEGLTGPRGQEFLAFIGNEVPGALTELGHTVGNIAAGMGELWMAFTPVNRDATGWLLDASRDFDEWAQGLSQTEGFEDFIAYIRENGPRVADALGSVGNAVLQIAEAMAPLGGPALEALTAFADVVAFIANSPIGPPLAAAAASMVLISRSMQAMQAVKASTLFGAMTTSADGASRSMSKLGRAMSTATGAAVGLEIMRAAIEAIESSLDAALPTSQELVGNLLDISAGEAGGLGSGFDGLAESIGRADAASGGFTGKLTSIAGFADKYGGGGLLGLAFDSPAQKAEDAEAQITALDAALADLATTAGPKEAEAAFRALAESEGLSAEQASRLLGMMPQYRDALAGIENQARLTGDGVKEGFDRGTTAAQRFSTAVQRLNNMLEGRAELRDYEAALDDFTKGLKENGRSFDINTNKGRLNQENLDNIAGTLGRVVDGMKRTERQPVLEQARKDIRDMREAGQLSEAQMRFLLAEVNKLDKASARPKIDIDTAGVAGAIAGVNAALNGIQDETVYINVKRGPAAGAALGVKGSAYGENEIPGQRWPYGDKTLRAVAPGEAITTNRNGESDRNRDVIRMINAGVDVARQMRAGSSAASSSRPVVNVGGTTVAAPGVRVFIGERELTDIVRVQIDGAERFNRRLDDRD